MNETLKWRLWWVLFRYFRFFVFFWFIKFLHLLFRCVLLIQHRNHNLKCFAHWARRKQYKQRGHSININSSSCDNISGIFLYYAFIVFFSFSLSFLFSFPFFAFLFYSLSFLASEMSILNDLEFFIPKYVHFDMRPLFSSF